MKTKSILSILIFLFFSLTALSQNSGTLKVFSEEPVIVFVDQVQQPSYDAITLPEGTHYVKVFNKNEERIYSEIVTIVANKVTSILIETMAAPIPQQSVVKPSSPSSAKGTGTINIFSEFVGTSIYLNENKQGDDIKVINSVPAGNHYLKIMKDGVSIFGDLVTVSADQTTTVLVKNDGQVAEKILESKSKEREEYQAKKIDILFTTNSVTTTEGASTLFPGYYGYWGYSKSVSSTQQISDFKIVQGGVKELGEIQLANLANNQEIIKKFSAEADAADAAFKFGAITFFVSALIAVPLMIDMLGEKHFLHKDTPVHPKWEGPVLGTTIVTSAIGYLIFWGSDHGGPDHYYKVDEAAKDAKKHNDKLKKDLGLPESYDVK